MLAEGRMFWSPDNEDAAVFFIALVVFLGRAGRVWGVDSYLPKRWRNLRSGKRRTCSASVSDAELLLPSLFRFCSQRESTGQGIEDFRVPERPGIINRHSLEAPLVAIAH
jgi:hypothetical protein